MDKKELLDTLRMLAEAVDASCKDDAADAGAVVTGILDNTKTDCTYETVRKIVSAITQYSDVSKMSLAKCLKEDGWADNGWASDECNGAVLNLKVTELGVPMARVAQSLYNGLVQKQKELLLELVFELIPLFLRDEDCHVNGLEDIAEENLLEEWARDNGWKHPDHDSISDFAEGVDNGEVRDFVVEYIQDNL